MASSDVTLLLHAVQRGTDGAVEALVPLVYHELYDLAVHFMRGERDDHTLQPTALVHDAYLRLVQQQHVSWKCRAHFYGIASQAMRRILVDHARRRLSAKRDFGDRVTLDHAVAESPNESVDLIALDEALSRLASLDERAARVVELRYFGGMNLDGTAEALGVSVATVKRDWTFARAFLRRELEAT